jgi:ABC-type glycerol-3-phosphate transport system permease component
VIGALLTVGALITAFPFLWMIFASVKPRSSPSRSPQLLPATRRSSTSSSSSPSWTSGATS